MVIIKTLIFAFLSTVGFSVLFTTPKDSIVKAGIVGSIGWGLYYISSLVLNNSIISTLIASISIGIVGELFAKYYKKPATVFIIPGIIPLVPGAGMYYTMLELVEKNYYAAVDKGTETFFLAAAISIGLIISTTLSTSIKRAKSKN
ncbi:MAG: threonine/serine exporter [Tissierellia bacterium]|nr:threonine/serine exporter [Tissierellia bacterium]